MKILLFILVFFLPFLASAQNNYKTENIKIGGWNAIASYDSVMVDSMECIVDFMGAGEVGTDTATGQAYPASSKLALWGPHYWLRHGFSGVVPLGNGNHHPLYISLQQPNQSTKPPGVLTIYNAIKTMWKIKSHAFYMSGYSAGGWQALEFIFYQPTVGDHSYAQRVTAALAIEAVKPSNLFDGTVTVGYPECAAQASPYTKIWGFDQTGDAGRDMATWTAAMNNRTAGSVLYFRTDAGAGNHCCFNVFVDPSQIWSSTNSNVSSIVIGPQQVMNSFQWLLRQGDTTLNGGSSPNQPPVVTGTGGGTISLPTTSKSISCTVVDEGGSLAYAWSKVSGPSSFAFSASNSQSTNVTNLVAGTYDFRVNVTDTGGLSGSADVIVTVTNGANTPPIAVAGSDQSITLPTNQVTLNGSASSDPGGTISTYQWRQIGGSAVNVVSPSQAITAVNGFNIAGVYPFVLTVTDNLGASSSDTVNVTVVSNNTGQEVDAFVSIDGGTNQFIDPQWNAWNDSANATLSNIKDINGNLLPWTANFSTPPDIRDNTATYGNGQTLAFPQGSIRHTRYQPKNTYTLSIGALSLDQTYNIILMCSRNVPAGTQNLDTFKIGNNIQTINTTNNYNTPLTFPNITPNSNGTIVITGSTRTGDAGNYINAFKIIQIGEKTNTPPTATVSADQLIFLPTDSTIISGRGSDADGDSLTYNWQFTSGPRLDTVRIDSASNASTKIRNLVQGTYVMTLTVTDTHGATANAQMTVDVSSSTGSVLIVAPRDTVMGLSQIGGLGNEAIRDTTQIKVTATAGPNVTNYFWSKISGTGGTIATPNAQTTNIYGLTVGKYQYRIKGFNLTDSAFDTVNITIKDYQTSNEHGFRVGPPHVHFLTATNSTQAVKTNYYATQAAIGDTVLGDDTIKIIRNPNNGGVYTLLNLSGVSGVRGHPVIVTCDTTIDVAGTIRIGNGNDSSGTSFLDCDFRVPKKGIKYGLVNKLATPTASANGLVLNYTSNVRIQGVYTHNVGIGMFIKNNPDSSHTPQIFNKFRFMHMEVAFCFFDGSVAENNYIGNTSPDGVTGAGGDGPSTRVDTILYHDNTVRHAGYDGVQIVNAVYEEMYNNFVLGTGELNASSQRYMSQMGGNTTGRVHHNFFYNGREGVTGTPYGQVEYDHNFVDSVYIPGGVGAGRPHGFTMYGGLCGPVTGSTVREFRDSTTFNLHDNIAMNCDSNYFRIHNFQNFNSVLLPSHIQNNWLIDSTGRTLAQLIANSSGSQFNINNHLVNGNTFKVKIQDLSSQIDGPLVNITVGNSSQTFTSSSAAFDFIMNKLNPPIISVCPCLITQQPDQSVIKSN